MATTRLVFFARAVWKLRSDSGSTNAFYYGIPGDIPVTGDWDNNGDDTVGVVRPVGHWLLRDSKDCCAAEEDYWFGTTGDTPLPGWDGDGEDNAGITRNP